MGEQNVHREQLNVEAIRRRLALFRRYEDAGARHQAEHVAEVLASLAPAVSGEMTG